MRRNSLWLALTILAMAVWAGLSWAETDLKVSSLLEDPGSFQAQVVRVSGVVTNHKVRRWGPNKCVQSFVVKDPTGSIRAMQQASCAGAKHSLRNRDFVVVEGRFEWAPGQAALLKVQSIVAKVAPSAE